MTIWWSLPAVIAGCILGLMAAGATGGGLDDRLLDCVRQGAASASRPMVLIVAIGLALLGAAAKHLVSQALSGRRALCLARQHAVVPPADLLDIAGRLGIRRLLLTRLDGDVAFCAGLARTTVVIGDGLLQRVGTDALTAILAHEASHARRRDPLRRIAMESLARALWLVPAASIAASRLHRAVELRADAAAVRAVGRRPLIEALLVLHRLPDQEPSGAVAGAGDLLEARIDALDRKGPPARDRLPLSVAARSAAGLSVLAAPLIALVAAPGAVADPLVAAAATADAGPAPALAATLCAALTVVAIPAARSLCRGLSSTASALPHR